MEEVKCIETEGSIDESHSLIKFYSPSTLLLVGQSNAGKSSYMRKLVEYGDKLFTIPPSRYIWLYNIFQPLYENIVSASNGKLTFDQGLPTRADIETWAKGEPHLVILCDDLYHLLINSKDILDMFVLLSHHLCITFVASSHNVFMGGRFSKTITLNLSYILCFRLNNRLQLSTLATQLFCHQKNAKNFVQAYDECMLEDQFSPLIIDLCPQSKHSELRIRKDVLPGQYPKVFALE